MSSSDTGAAGGAALAAGECPSAGVSEELPCLTPVDSVMSAPSRRSSRACFEHVIPENGRQ